MKPAPTRTTRGVLARSSISTPPIAQAKGSESAASANEHPGWSGMIRSEGTWTSVAYPWLI